MKSFKDSLAPIACVSMLLFATVAHPAMIRVPADRPTIQGAIDVAVDGDEIVVAPGVYNERVLFGGKAITVRSEQGAAVTEIHNPDLMGEQLSTVTFTDAEGQGSILRGFKITGMSLKDGSAMYISDASPTIIENIFTGNDGTGSIYLSGSNARIERNLFTRNAAGDDEIAINRASSPIVSNNVFSGPYCRSALLGSPAAGTPQIVNNTILNCSVGVSFYPGTGTGQWVFRNNVISMGPSTETTEGLNAGDNAANIVWENNLVFGAARPYVGIADQTGVNGNLSADPLLGGGDVLDFRPDNPASPLVDAGVNSEVQPGDVDFHGGARINVATNVVDIGAAEYYSDAPTISMALSPTTILPGQTAELTWTVTNAASCEASSTWSGPRPLTGSLTLNPTAFGQHNYTLTCERAGVRRSSTATLLVPPLPSIDLRASAQTVVIDKPFTLSWFVYYADSCDASGDWSGAKPLRGTESLPQAALGQRTFTLTCTGPGGTNLSSVTLDVVPPPSVTITVDPGTILTSGSATLRWNGANVRECSPAGSWSGSIETSGERTLSNLAAGAYSYGIACLPLGGNQTVTAWATLAVNDAPSSAFSGGGGGGGGGGAMSPFWLLLLLVTSMARARCARR